MEKERFFCIDVQSPEAGTAPVQVNCGKLPQPFLTVGWDQPGGRFESALGSLVDPSMPHSSDQLAGGECALVCELVGRLGGVCGSREVSAASQYQNDGSSSPYDELLGSPPKLNLARLMLGSQVVAGQLAAPFTANQGFAERAAWLSFFGTRCSYDGLREQFGELMKANGTPPSSVPDSGKETALSPEETELGSVQESATQPNASPTCSAENNAKKRKAATKAKGKAPPLSSSNTNPPKGMKEENYESKRCKTAEDRAKPKTEQSGDDNDGQKQGKKNNAKPPEQPKEYIHVRARRGQATDSHSLAERVRREKISERMKLLQDLVPGCNKITGKALMLDEIINYVQSLQRQVEFLSTKLATLNPQLYFNIDTLLHKDAHQEDKRMAEQVYPQLDLASTAFSYARQPQSLRMQAPLNNPSISSLDPLDGFAGATPQLGNFWEDDLQYVVQSAFSSQGLCAE